MCGIVGYIGQNDAYPVLIEGLKKLEYRGYDSAGVALINGQDQLNVYKTKGKVSNLEAMAAEKDCSGHVGIAHTRWATHGEPSATNAHPHVSMSGDLALVHNGIIENYQVLKEQLIEKGYEFKSTTDTEVLVQLIEKMCRKRVEVAYASEFRYGDPVIEPEDVVIAISQSGETADTLAAIKLAKEKGALIFGIVNGVGSSIARETDTGIYIHVGPEIGVASTKAFTGQVTVLTLLALALGHEQGTLNNADYYQMIEELSEIPQKMEKVLEQAPMIKDISKMFTYAHNFLYLGRGVNYPVAMEGALKLKEISYIHAEGYPAAEMKHGPIALVDQDMPIVFLATHHQLYEKIISNMQEVKSRNGRILAVVTEGDQQVKEIADNILEVPRTLNALVPLLSVVPLQLLAYYVAVDKGLDVDMPRNLAKSVTVE